MYYRWLRRSIPEADLRLFHVWSPGKIVVSHEVAEEFRFAVTLLYSTFQI